MKTVEHLESEVKSLLNIIGETASNIPIAPGTPLMDIFDGKYLVGYNLKSTTLLHMLLPNTSSFFHTRCEEIYWLNSA